MEPGVLEFMTLPGCRAAPPVDSGAPESFEAALPCRGTMVLKPAEMFEVPAQFGDASPSESAQWRKSPFKLVRAGIQPGLNRSWLVSQFRLPIEEAFPTGVPAKPGVQAVAWGIQLVAADRMFPTNYPSGFHVVRKNPPECRTSRGAGTAPGSAW